MKAGDKVVCVDDVFAADCRWKYSELPKKQTVYVVRDVRLGYQKRKLQPGILLVGIFGKTSPHGREYGFKPERFRPLSEAGHPPVALAQPVSELIL